MSQTPDDKQFDTRPKPPAMPPEMPEADATRAQAVDDRTKGMPPVQETNRIPPPPPPMPRPAPPLAEKPKRGQPPPPPPQQQSQRVAVVEKPPRARSPFYLPIWSVLLMLIMVGGTVSCIVVAVLGLGGRQIPASPPQFVIITANPTSAPEITLPSLLVSPTLPAGFESAGVPNLALEGPTLAPIVFTPTMTPAPEIAIGSTVRVAGTNGINVRAAAGTDQAVVTVADPGDTFVILDGPQDANGLTWWKIQDQAAGITGWAAQNDGTQELLQVISP